MQLFFIKVLTVLFEAFKKQSSIASLGKVSTICREKLDGDLFGDIEHEWKSNQMLKLLVRNGATTFSNNALISTVCASAEIALHLARGGL